MNETEFWNLIAACKLAATANTSRFLELLQRTLERESEPAITDFSRLLHEQMAKSYTRELWAAAYIINGGCSDDGFDCFRAWLIACGKEIFENALRDPETLAEIAPPDVELEPLLYVAGKAYQAKTKRRFVPPARPKIELTGEEWVEDDLPAKFPKLYAWINGQERRGAKSDAHLNLARMVMKQVTARHLDAPDKIIKIFKESGLPPSKAGLGPILEIMKGAFNQADLSPAEMLYRQGILEGMNEKPEALANSISLLTQAADMDHAGAQFMLGSYCQMGRGVKQDYAKAAERYRQAAEQGHADACGALGALYHQGLELDQDYPEAARWYQKGAEGGSVEAEFGLGVLYSDGLGVQQNDAEAFKWFHRAAQNGNERAALNVGLYYLNGKGVEPDAALAFEWFVRSADAGSVQARYNLGVLYEKGLGVIQDFHKAGTMYQTAADQGDAKAMLNLGMLYANGKGVSQDYARAAQLYQQAAAAGNLIALSNLAVLYQHGRGVPKDPREAVRLNRQCAEAGVAIGQYNLGTLYHRGIGVDKDDKEAVRWYRLAAEQNQPAAMNNLADAYEKGCGVEQDYAQAAAWYRQAADRGISASYYSLGIFYRDGLGVKQDYQEAEKCLKLAVEKGYEKAAPALEKLYAEGLVPFPKTETPLTSPLGSSAESRESPEPGIVAPPAAALRALCLRAFIRRFELEALLQGVRQHPGVVELLDPDGLRKEARRINAWLKDEELWLTASENEKKLFKLSPGSWPKKIILNMAWRAEALGAIGWALHLTDKIPPYDAQLEPDSFVYHLQLFGETKPFVSAARLRTEKEILAAREIAENWLWRARTTQIQKEPDKYPPPPGMTFEKVIALAATHWEKQGLFTAVNEDYPARGKAYAQLNDAEWQELRSIATERLYGLNWLCGYSANWDLVPTGT
ncbi:MAG: DUF4272 domain-containing protein [Verrucomicrobiota bacterium]